MGSADIFAGTSFTSSAMAMNFESEIALLEMRKQRGTDTVDDRVKSSAVAEKAWEKMNCFIKAQTKLHSRAPGTKWRTGTRAIWKIAGRPPMVPCVV